MAGFEEVGLGEAAFGKAAFEVEKRLGLKSYAAMGVAMREGKY